MQYHRNGILILIAWFMQASAYCQELSIGFPFSFTGNDVPWLLLDNAESNRLYKSCKPARLDHKVGKSVGAKATFRLPELPKGQYTVSVEAGFGYGSWVTWYELINIDGAQQTYVTSFTLPNTFLSMDIKLPELFARQTRDSRKDMMCVVFRMDTQGGSPDPYFNFSSDISTRADLLMTRIIVPFLIPGRYLFTVQSTDGAVRAYQREFDISKQHLFEFELDAVPIDTIRRRKDPGLIWKVDESDRHHAVADDLRAQRNAKAEMFYFDSSGHITGKIELGNESQKK